MRILEKVFYLVLFLVTCFIQFGMAQIQDTIGKYVNTRPLEQHTLKDGRILVILDDLWKNTQLVPFENKQRFLLRKGSVALPIMFELPDTVNAWIVDVRFTRYAPNQPPPPDPVTRIVNDQGSTITYSANWFPVPASTNAGWIQKFNNKDVTYTVTVGAAATYVFTGTKVDVIGEMCDNHGIAKIDILKGTTVVKTANADMYKNTGGSGSNACPNGEKTIIYSSGDLPKDTYTVRVQFLSADLTKTPRRDSMVFDGFQVYE